jgi:hypothetical protein
MLEDGIIDGLLALHAMELVNTLLREDVRVGRSDQLRPASEVFLRPPNLLRCKRSMQKIVDNY